eukprot:6202333-Pleurochrysis_carterae.AAC.1
MSTELRHRGGAVSSFIYLPHAASGSLPDTLGTLRPLAAACARRCFASPCTTTGRARRSHAASARPRPAHGSRKQRRSGVSFSVSGGGGGFLSKRCTFRPHPLLTASLASRQSLVLTPCHSPLRRTSPPIVAPVHIRVGPFVRRSRIFLCYEALPLSALRTGAPDAQTAANLYACTHAHAHAHARARTHAHADGLAHNAPDLGRMRAPFRSGRVLEREKACTRDTLCVRSRSFTSAHVETDRNTRTHAQTLYPSVSSWREPTRVRHCIPGIRSVQLRDPRGARLHFSSLLLKLEPGGGCHPPASVSQNGPLSASCAPRRINGVTSCDAFRGTVAVDTSGITEFTQSLDANARSRSANKGRLGETIRKSLSGSHEALAKRAGGA